MTLRNRIGVVLLNLGGPRSEAEIADFLYSLLSDPEVLTVPWPIRPLLARLIARRRAPKVAKNYQAIGGKSPLAEQTESQVQALQERLGDGFWVDYAFRHSPPSIQSVFDHWVAQGIRQAVALPAYPQYSQSTTGSALDQVKKVAGSSGLEIQSVRSYPRGPGFIQALAELTRPRLSGSPNEYVLMSAHGLPERMIEKGDPYLDEVRQTASDLAERLPPYVPHSLAFQSRLGPVAWLKPYLDQEIQRLGQSGVRSLILVPLSFSCENLETRYELDLEIAELAKRSGIDRFQRIPAPGCHPGFVTELARQVMQITERAGWTPVSTAAGTMKMKQEKANEN